MNPPTRTTSSTGNKRGGFTFVEVMVTLVVLSFGIVFIYKTFFLCVDYLSRLSTRLQAHELIDRKVADISRIYRESGDLSMARGDMHVNVIIDRRPRDFTYHISMDPVLGLDELYNVNVGISWTDNGRPQKMARAAVIAR